MIFITIFAFIVIFSFLILIHEWGHFAAAKRAGVKVEEFGFGLPPRIWGVKRGETLYSINWIPFGGFVRMLGEDSKTAASKKSPRSFSNQPFRTQAFIVCAGVLMNLLTAFILLTIGFLVGIEPLISSEADFYNEIRKGTVLVEPGILVVESNAPYSKVIYNGEAIEIRSFEPGDRLLGLSETQALDEGELWFDLLAAASAGEEAPLVLMDRADGSGGAEYLSKELLEQTEFAPLYLPRLAYTDKPDSPFHGFLQSGDVLLSLNGSVLLTEEDLFQALASLEGEATFDVYRSGQGVFELTLTLPRQGPVVSFVESDSPAQTAGFQKGDQLLTVLGQTVTSAETVVTLTQSFIVSGEGALVYEVIRNGEVLSLEATPREETGTVGIGLANPLPFYGDLSLYPTYQLHTLMEVKDLRYGPAAPWVAVREMGRLGEQTAVMFVNVLKQFITGGEVPEGVSGPVGIAQMTHLTLQEGWAATLRLVALLSLSLGVINILPVPALDGAKLLFIVAQGVLGRKMSTRWEHLIHATGFFFLILFLIYVTFNDVLRLF